MTIRHRAVLLHRTKQMLHRLSGAGRCTAPQLVSRPVRTDGSSVWVGPLAAALCLAAGPALAATCHMTVQGVPIVDDLACTFAGHPGDVRVAIGGSDVVRIRRSAMSGRFVVRHRPDGRLRRIGVSYGQVVTSTDSDDKTCYFNQRATLCIDP